MWYFPCAQSTSGAQKVLRPGSKSSPGSVPRYSQRAPSALDATPISVPCTADTPICTPLARRCVYSIHQQFSSRFQITTGSVGPSKIGSRYRGAGSNTPLFLMFHGATPISICFHTASPAAFTRASRASDLFSWPYARDDARVRNMMILRKGRAVFVDGGIVHVVVGGT